MRQLLSILLFSFFVSVLPAQNCEVSDFKIDFKTAIAEGILLPMKGEENANNSVQKIFISGIWEVNTDYSFAPGSVITMDAGAEIIVSNNSTLRLDNVSIQGKEYLWNRILVETGGKLILKNGSKVKDALYAIELQNNAAVFIENTLFSNNYTSIYSSPQPFPQTAILNISHTNFEGGALLPAFNKSTDENWSYAGILLNDFAALTMVNGWNTFRNLANGIVAYRSNIQIDKSAVFANISLQNYNGKPDGNAIYLDGFENGASGIYGLSFTGFGTAATDIRAFDNCHIGIQSLASHLNVTDAKMNLMGRFGVHCQEAKMCKINILNNNIVLKNNRKAIAIGLTQNDHAATTTTVAGNVLTIGQQQLIGGQVNTLAYGGIAVFEQGISYPLSIKNNNISQDRCSYGIYVLNNLGADISNNNISFTRATGQPFNRDGILLQNCAKYLLRCNSTSYSFPGTFARNITGINIEHSTFGKISCNSMAKIETGMRFHGVCTGSDILTNIFNTHDVGLLYTSTAVTGFQFDKGNQWFGNYGTAGAVNLGGAVNFPNNRYEIQNSAPFAPPGVIVGFGNWFTPSPNPFQQTCNPSLNCGGSILFPLASINNLDVAIVNNQMPQNPQAMPWELRKGLYDKLDKNPILRLNSAMGAFYNNYNTQAIADVVEAYDALKLTGNADSIEIVLTEQYKNTTNLMLDTIQALDSLYMTGQLVDTVFIVQKTQSMQQLQQHVIRIKNFNTILHNNSSLQSQQAQLINNSILPGITAETNEKKVNEIYLQRVALGNSQFTNAERQRLYDIARMCPDMDGNAVYRARSIYAMIDREIYIDRCIPQTKSAKFNGECNYSDVNFVNPSLEGIPGSEAAPSQWVICESTPDIHPRTVGMPAASDSLTYAGVAGSNLHNFKEAFGSLLIDTLQTGQPYKFSFDYAAFYNIVGLPAYISIWLGDSLCNKDQLIFSELGTDTFWRTKTVQFIPNANYTYFIISAEFNASNQVNEGFIDNLRPVPRPSSCDTVFIHVTEPTDSISEPIIEDIMNLIGEFDAINFNIYPNPNQLGLLTVDWQKNISKAEIVVVDALGREVAKYPLTAIASKQQIDIKHLLAGYYSVLLRKENRVIGREKLIIMRD